MKYEVCVLVSYTIEGVNSAREAEVEAEKLFLADTHPEIAGFDTNPIHDEDD